MKRVMTHVSCENGYAHDRPDIFIVTISNDLKQRIKELSQAVRDAGAYRIEELNSDGVWSESYLDQRDLDSKSVDKVTEELVDNKARVERALLEVTSDHFRWSCVPRYRGDEDILLKTKKIPVSFLDDVENLYLGLD